MNTSHLLGYQISGLELFYFSGWVSLISAVLVIIKRKDYEFITLSYIKFLSEPWKLLTFALAMMIIILAAPYSGDYTWDTQD